MKKEISGALLLYRCPISNSASTILEHVNSFDKYSKLKVWPLNTLLGFSEKLKEFNFKVIILHYSLFGSYPFGISEDFKKYIKSLKGVVKICFFQDEMQNCGHRFKMIDELEIDEIYSLIDPEFYELVYFSKTKTKVIHHTLTGYVDDSLILLASQIGVPEEDRSTDIGYRGRVLPFYMGKGGQEKVVIAEVFNEMAKDLPLKTDIAIDESSRIYGDAWYHFIANCKGMIGVESGVSIFDIDDNIKTACDSYLKINPGAGFDEVSEAVLAPWEDNIYYRTISPRVFECAALRVCMIHFEGRYNDIISPMEHYIPLKKDFSNFDWVISVFNDPKERKRITDNAYRDLIASEKYTYKEFIDSFDENLLARGLDLGIHNDTIRYVTHQLNKGTLKRTIIIKSKEVANKKIDAIVAFARKYLKKSR